MILNQSIAHVLLLPPVLLLVSGLVLFSFQNLYRFLTFDLKRYMTIPAVQSLKPFADNLRYALEHVLGKASSFKFNVSHVLMMAVLIVLIAIYDAIQKNNRLQEHQLKLRQKSKRSN